MNIPTTHKVVFQDGRPVEVTIPYSEYLVVFTGQNTSMPEPTVPHEVVEAHFINGQPWAQAWREHLGLSQDEVAGRMGITQAAYQQMEKHTARPRKATLEKLAAALGLEVDLLKI